MLSWDVLSLCSLNSVAVLWTARAGQSDPPPAPGTPRAAASV